MFPVYLFNFNIVVILSYSFHVKYIYDDMFKSSSANRELIVAPIDNLFNGNSNISLSTVKKTKNSH